MAAHGTESGTLHSAPQSSTVKPRPLLDERSCKVDDIASRGAGLSLHGFLCLFPCDLTLNVLECFLSSGTVRRLDGVEGCARYL